jgi:hypothetical protein
LRSSSREEFGSLHISTISTPQDAVKIAGSPFTTVNGSPG